MISKRDRDKAMTAIRDYYDRHPAGHTIYVSFLRTACGLDPARADETVRVLVALGLITYVPDPGDTDPCIRLTPGGQTYAELQADLQAAARKATRQFAISTALSVAALLIALFDLFKGCLL